MNIIFWLISALFASVWASHYKKAVLSSKLPTALYMLMWPILGFLIVWLAIFFSWLDISIYTDYYVLWLVFIIMILDICANYLEMSVLKTTKLSDILPYTNLDKLFIVLLWFFLFYWTKNSTSITTLIITLITIIIITLFSIDFKNFKIPKSILSYVFVMLFRWITVLIVWFIFVKYSTLSYLSVNILFSFLWYLAISIILKNSLYLYLDQSKTFYKSRLLSALLIWIWLMISLYVVKEAWVLIATLISFIALVFNIISMKFILNDNPWKKQIILAWLITVLIWIWYYFK